MKRSDFEAPIAKLVESFARALTDLSFKHFAEAHERAKKRAAELLREELEGRPVAKKTKPRRAKAKVDRAASAPTPKVVKPPPVASATTVKGKPRERRPMRCSKCGAEGFRADGCGRTHNVAASPSDDTVDAEDEPRAPRGRRARGKEMDHVSERVIPHATLVAMLAADRAQNDVGDAGGFVGGRSSEPSLVGHTDEKRELCPVHGWVGRIAFEREHFACLPAGDPCARCEGKPPRTGSLVCKRCKGTGIEPAPTIAEIVPPTVPTPAEPKERSRRREQLGMGTRADTIAPKKLTRAVLAAGAEGLEGELAQLDALRPKTRADCIDDVRPCPWVSCKHHLALDINPETGSIKINFPDIEPWELQHTCALDVAEQEHTLEEVGAMLNVTRERLRQIEVVGLHKLKGTRIVQHGIGPGAFANHGEHPLAGEGE